jgi:hypothetical protein
VNAGPRSAATLRVESRNEHVNSVERVGDVVEGRSFGRLLVLTPHPCILARGCHMTHDKGWSRLISRGVLLLLAVTACGGGGEKASPVERACKRLALLSEGSVDAANAIILDAAREGVTADDFRATCEADIRRALSTANLPDHERNCPGFGSVEVVYRSGGSRGNFTAQMPTGMRQGMYAGPVRECFDRGAFVYFAVQNDTDRGSVSCSIQVDGATIAENTSVGAYVIASCDGRAQ